MARAGRGALPTVLIKRYYAHGRPSRGVHVARTCASPRRTIRWPSDITVRRWRW